MFTSVLAFSQPTKTRIEDILNPHCVLILCDTSVNFMENVFLHRGEEVADSNDIQYLKYMYSAFFKASKIRSKRTFDVEKDTNFEKIFKYLKRKISRYNKKYINAIDIGEPFRGLSELDSWIGFPYNSF